jgi:hypothetical protein
MTRLTEDLDIMEHCLILLWRVFSSLNGQEGINDNLRHSSQEMFSILQKIGALELVRIDNSFYMIYEHVC